MARAGNTNVPGPFNFPERRARPFVLLSTINHHLSTISDFRLLISNIGRAPARAAESPKLSLLGAAPRRPANLVGPWLKSEVPALQAEPSGSVTRRTPPFHCGENEIQASLISSTSVGATPTPATILVDS